MISEEQIWSYLDGTLNAADRKYIELAIENDKHAAALFQEITALHQSLKSETLLSPSASFTDQVMAAINMSPTYTPVAKISFKPFLLFVLPSLLAVAAFAVMISYNHVPLSYTIPVDLPAFKNFQLYFIIGDVLLLAYFIDRFSEYRFNRKTLFAQ